MTLLALIDLAWALVDLPLSALAAFYAFKIGHKVRRVSAWSSLAASFALLTLTHIFLIPELVGITQPWIVEATIVLFLLRPPFSLTGMYFLFKALKGL